MDENGYVPSIIEPVSDCECYICHKRCRTQRHEVFHGSVRRERSKQYGLWVSLCPECHYKLHNSDGTLDTSLKEEAEIIAIIYYHFDKQGFIKLFSKNYLDEELINWLNTERFTCHFGQTQQL